MTTYFLYFIIALAASLIGAISGIGGGIIIKPTLDAISGLNIYTINFLSGCTVLAMSCVSLLLNKNSNTKINYKTSCFMVIGASLGGIVGKVLFNLLKNNIQLLQMVILLLINIGVLIYIKNKSKIKTISVKNNLFILIIGALLGTVSSFLGIGGGPINIVVLSFFFSMNSKESALSSLFIIFFSQSTSLIGTVISNTIPAFSLSIMLLMCSGGIIGAACGRKIIKTMDNKSIDTFFSVVLYGLISLNIFNIISNLN